MRKYFIAGNIFQVMYRVSNLDRIFISKELAKERIFSLVDFNHPENLANFKRDLKEHFNITNKNTMYQTIMHYENLEYDGVLTHLLYKAYKDFEGELADIKWEEFASKYLNEKSLKVALKIYLINYSNEDFDDYKKQFESFSKDFFEPSENNQNLVFKFVYFISQMGEFFSLCENTTISAFSYARVLQILNLSYAVGYINEQEYEKESKFYINNITNIFSCFGEFFASFLLGSAFLRIGKNSDVIQGISEHINALYIVLNSPYNMLKESGIWPNSLEADRERLNEILLKYIDKNNNEKQLSKMNLLLDQLKQEAKNQGFSFEIFTQTLDLFYENFYNILKEHRVEFLVSTPDKNLFFTPRDGLDFQFYVNFRAFAKKAKIYLEDGEFPILLNLNGKKTLITNKAIYIQSGVLLFKKIKKIPWTQTNFKIRTHYIGVMRCFVSEDEYFDISLHNYKRLTSKKIECEQEKDDATYSSEITALMLAFNQLKKYLLMAG